MPELVCAADDPGWLAARRAGVTATDIVTILGLSSTDSAYSLYYRKRGEVPDLPDNDRWRLGRELEPYIFQRWWQEHSSEHGDYNSECARLLWRNSERPWQLATPDQVLSWAHEDESIAGTPRAVVECKTWADADKPSWQDGPPPAVRAQVLWQMDVMSVTTGHVGVVFLPSGEFRSHVIELDDAAEADIMCMIAAGTVFYDRMRGNMPPPTVDGSAATLAAVRARFPKPADRKVVAIDSDLYDGWSSLKAAATVAQNEARQAESKIREQLGEATDIEVDGQVVARRRVYDSPVKAHVRHVDGIWPVKTNGGNDA
jgi:putative phage-type endonuclease